LPSMNGYMRENEMNEARRGDEMNMLNQLKRMTHFIIHLPLSPSSAYPIYSFPEMRDTKNEHPPLRPLTLVSSLAPEMHRLTKENQTPSSNGPVADSAARSHSWCCQNPSLREKCPSSDFPLPCLRCRRARTDPRRSSASLARRARDQASVHHGGVDIKATGRRTRLHS
jgi:hypothetical protein